MIPATSRPAAICGAVVAPRLLPTMTTPPPRTMGRRPAALGHDAGDLAPRRDLRRGGRAKAAAEDDDPPRVDPAMPRQRVQRLAVMAHLGFVIELGAGRPL